MKLRDIKRCYLGTHLLWLYYGHDFDVIERAERTGRVSRRVLRELRNELRQAEKRALYAWSQGERPSQRDEELLSEWDSYRKVTA